MNNCITCCWWEEIENFAKHGYCRRYPPAVIGRYVDSPDEYGIYVATKHPVTYDLDRCGEWTEDAK